jgi:phospholipid/cholesterol/gamma-HCH transport system substrate-binding protein
LTITAPPVSGPDTSPVEIADASRNGSWRLVALGVAFVALLVAIIVVVLESFGGAFSTYATVEAELPAASTAVAVGAPVEYRNVTVGTVASQGRSVPGGFVVLILHMQSQMLPEIPAQVRATETPVSFFGDPYVELLSSSPSGSARLHAGEDIPALQTAQTGSLQATLGSLDHLLIRLHPAELDAALTALASAIQGNGTSLGHNLVRANTYFRQMLPLWPTVVSNLKTLVPVANQFATSTPDILQILANQTTTANTITDQASGVRSAIGGGETLSGEAAQLLTAIQQPFNILTADSGPFLTAISQNPEEISQLLHGLDAWANAWISAESSGPYLDLTQTEVVANPADLGLAVLGGPQAAAYLAAGLGSGYVNPPTYSSADPALTGKSKSIPSGSASAVASVASTAPVLSEPAQTRAVSEIVSAVSGSVPSSSSSSSSSSVSTLLLSPVLESLVTRS